MKFKLIANLSLAFLIIASAANAQQGAPASPPAAAPTTNYDYHETFGVPFFNKNGSEYRAADGHRVQNIGKIEQIISYLPN